MSNPVVPPRPVGSPGPGLGVAAGSGTRWRSSVERATLREILMGAQDNLTNVLAVALGVTVGAGRADMVALAGLAAATAEAISMGGVLYTATRAEQAAGAPLEPGGSGAAGVASDRLGPTASGTVTFCAAFIGGLIPLVPFAILPLPAAIWASILVSIVALFALGSLTGRIAGHVWWRDGLRLLLVAGTAALASALVGTILRVE